PFFYVRLRSTGSGVYDNQLPVLDEIMLPKAAALVSKGSSAWELGLDASGKAVFTTAGVGGGTLTGGTELAPRTWTHVAGVWDGTTKWIFVNGEMDASASGLSGSVGLNDLAVRLGGSPTAAAAGFAGRLDEVRIWSGARTKELIAANAERTLTGHEPGLTAWFSFDHDNGLAVTDRKTPVNTNDQVTIDFENPDLQHDDNQTKRLPNNATYSNSKRYEEDTFRLDNLSAVSVFYTVGTKHHDYSGSTALYTNDQNGATRLTAIDGGLFRLRSITLHDFDNRPTGAIIPFTVTLENDLMIQRTLLFTGGGKPATFTFPDLLRVKAVEWKQAGGFYQFDDIVVQRSVADADSRLATGKLVNMTDRNLDDGISLGDAAPAEYALRFNGVDHYVEVPHAATLDLSSFTIEAWVRPEANGTTFRNILMKGQDGYGLALDQYGLLRYWVSGNSADALACTTIATTVAVDAAAGTNVAVQVADVTGLGIGTVVSIGDETNLTIGAVDPTAKTVTVTLAAPKASGEVVRVTPVSDGNWHHVAVSVDQTTNTTKLYVDGQPAGEHEQRTANNNSGALVIGRQGINTAAGYFKGDLNELRIWDHVRSEAEVALLANRQLVAGMTGLIAYWNLDDGVGLAALDTSGNAHDGALKGAASEWKWVHGPQPPYRIGMYALTLAGVDDYLHVPHSSTLDATDVTIEAWVYPLANTTADDYRTVVFKGKDGYNLAIDASGFISYWADVTAPTVLKSQRAVDNGRWQHVAVVLDSTGASVSFYIDGQPAGTVAGAITVTANTDPLVIGRQGLTGATAKNHFKGIVDELRVWGTARTAAEIAGLASRELVSVLPGLGAYWRLNEGEGLTATSLANSLEATLFNTDVSAWTTGQSRVDTDGVFWDASPVGTGQNFSRQTSSKGLWIGRVVLSAVNEVQKVTPTDPGNPAPTDDTASFRAIVHVDESGIVRLLKHVTLMQKAENQTENTIDEENITDNVARQIVLVSDDTKLPEFQGLIERRGKMIGKRISTVAYSFEGNEVELVGGVGGGLSLTGTITLPRLHPTNPFRHKYHPDHRNVNPDNADYGYEIVRNITFSFARPGGGVFESGGYGVDRLVGTYYEEVSGLHKVPIRVAGSVVLDRISSVAVLNE
ncbi:MAG: LamG domain-containing protein, partial [Lentisphaerae bacterium]|nr:LamG domain-containing protein [Lentisphaerota bacterium]